jgi:hypothetical protein
MSDRMKHRFVEHLGEWLRLIREMGLIIEKQLDAIPEHAGDNQRDSED